MIPSTLSAILLFSSLGAPQAPPPGPFSTQSRIDLGGEPEAILRRGVSCDMNGDHHTDVVTIDGNGLTFLHGPGYYTSRTPIHVQANDVLVRPQATAAGFDELVVVGDLGVRRIWFDFSDPQQGIIQAAAMGSSAWIGARRVLLAHADGQGAEMLVGVHADGHSILLMQDPWGAAADLPPIPFANEILDLCVADWSGDLESELSILTTATFEVRSIAGATIVSLPVQNQKGFLLPFRQDGCVKDRIIGVAQPTGTSSGYLYVLSDGVTEVPQFLGDVSVHGGAVADVDNDGDDDLVLSFGDSGDAFGLALAHNAADGLPSSSSLTFNLLTGFELVGTEGSPVVAPSHAAWPLLADFTNDGDVDIAYLSQSDRSLTIVENQQVDHQDRMLSPSMAESFVALDQNSANGQLLLALSPPTNGTEDFDHILVEQWIQASPAGIFHVGAYRFVHPLPQDWSAPISLHLWDDALINAGYLQHLDIRLAKLDGQGDVLEVGPTTIVSIGLFTETTDWLAAYHAALGTDVSSLLTTIDWGWVTPLPPGSGSAPSGGFVSPSYFPPLTSFGTSTLGPTGGPLPKPPEHDDDGPPPIPPVVDPNT